MDYDREDAREMVREEVAEVVGKWKGSPIMVGR